MNDDAEKLKHLLESPDDPAAGEWARELSKKYPYFPIAQAFELRAEYASLPDDERQHLVERLALSLPDTQAAHRLAEPDGDPFDNFYPPAQPKRKPSTDTTIDLFLETYGNESSEETATLEKLIFNPVPDYSQQLEREAAETIHADTTSGDSQLDRINRFINSQNPAKETEITTILKTPTATVQATEELRKPEPAISTENSLLSESLAKIYIKTHRYERAYEILNRLSLAVPEKNAYFADQLRFLRKVILAERMRKQINEAETSPEADQSAGTQAQ